MKTLSLLGCLLAAQLVYGQVIVYSRDPEPGFASRKISRQQLQEDIAFWHKVMEESHVNLYHAITKDSLRQLEASLLAAVPDSISQTDAVLLTGRLAAALNEGHIGLPSSSVTDSLYVASLRFPFVLQKVTDDSWIIDRDLSQEQSFTVNTAITSINGIPVKELNRRFREYYGGMETWRKQQIATYARKLLFLSGITSPFRVTAITEEGVTVTHIVTGFNKQQADSINKVIAASAAPKEPYSFTMLEGGIGYINYRSMSNAAGKPFDEFLKRTFITLRESNARGLVIDLRENGGGNSMYGRRLVNYITTKPYLFAKGMKWKISAHYKEYIRKASRDVLSADATFYNSMKDGDTYTYVNETLDTPDSTGWLFSGKVAVLIGPNTFSSANMMADGIRSYGLATLFGEPTGESGNDFGEMFNFMLPNSRIIARASTKMFTRADGDETNFNPVLPNVTVIPTAQDIKQKKDAVLGAAVNWIRQ